MYNSRILLGLIACFTCASPVAKADPVSVLVPAYFYPGTGGPGGVGDGWASMTNAASQVAITAIFNPNSGPGTAVDPIYVAAITSLENAGGKVVAYVPTGYTMVPLATAEGQIDTYVGQYGSLMQGFFVDEMTNDNSANDVAYYHDLYSYIKGKNPAYQVIGNPGTNTAEEYLVSATQGADVLVTFEDTAANYPSATPANWVSGYPAADFANIVHDEPSVSGMESDLALALGRNVGKLYVTDAGLPNPYDRLPSYWDQEVAAIASTPEPSGWILSLLGGLCCSAAAAIRRSRARPAMTR